MSYATVEAALQTILGYNTTVFPSSAAITRGDWRVLDGGHQTIAVLYAGAYAQASEDPALNEFQVTWTVNLALFEKYGNDSATRKTFAQKRDAILQQIMQYPTLHGLAAATAQLGRIASVGDPEPVFDKDDNGPFFLWQTFSIPVSEVLTITPLG